MLTNLRVVDCSRILVGSFASMVLSELGAEVIKVEQKKGDETRTWGPPFITSQKSVYFSAINKNKKSLALDLKQQHSQAILDDLVQISDIFIENLLSKNVEAFNLGYHRIAELNPQIIYVNINGYPKPLADKAAFDLTIQGQSGLMNMTGEPGQPMKVGFAVSDIFTAQQVVQSILLAIINRLQNNEGQFISTNLLQSALYNMSYSSHQYLLSGQNYQSLGNQHPNIVPYNIFKVQNKHLILGVATDLQFEKLASILGIQLNQSNSTNSERVSNRETVNQQIQSSLDRFQYQQVVQALQNHNLPFSEINNIENIMNNQQFLEMELTETIDQKYYFKYPAEFSTIQKRPDSQKSSAPDLGEHNIDILKNTLKYSPEKIDSLKGLGII